MAPYDHGSGKAAKQIIENDRPTRAEAEEAVDLLLRWIGEDPSREGLTGTPARVVRAWEEFCSGYNDDPASLLSSTFEEVEGALQPRGVAILIDAQHQCMTTRGVHKPGVSMVTTRFTGLFETDAELRARFMNQAQLG